MQTLEIGSVGRVLRLSELTNESYVAEIQGVDLWATEAVTHYRGDALDEFLQNLARDWRGWKGERSWQSLEGMLALRASISTGGAVAFDISLSTRAYEWRVELRLTVENEQLTQIAARSSAFFEQIGAAT